MSSPRLQNYLKSNRKRLALSQEEAAFLLGFMGEHKSQKVSRDESFARTPTLEMALAYEVIYGRPIRELFAGLYDRVERDVSERAKILTYKKNKQDPRRQQALANVVSKTTTK